MKKNYLNYEDLDLSRYHILSFDELLKVNGGRGRDSSDKNSESEAGAREHSSTKNNERETRASDGSASSHNNEASSENSSARTKSEETSKSKSKEVENTNEAVSKANVGDTVTRNDGTKATISEGDIGWAREKCANKNNGQNQKDSSGATASKNSKESMQDTGKTSSNHAKEDWKGNRNTADSATKHSNSETENPANPEENKTPTANENTSDDTADKQDYGCINESNIPEENTNSETSAQNSDEEALAAKKNSELNAPKKQGFFDKIVNVFNKASSPAGYAGEIAGNLANTDLQVGPILNEFAKKVSILGNAAVAMDFVNTTYNNMQSYQQGEMDCWQSAYNTVTHGISVTAGAGVCGTITASGAMGTFGLGAISAVTAGTLAGNATTKVIDFGFDWIEEKIWGEAK